VNHDWSTQNALRLSTQGKKAQNEIYKM